MKETYEIEFSGKFLYTGEDTQQYVVILDVDLSRPEEMVRVAYTTSRSNFHLAAFVLSAILFLMGIGVAVL